MILKEEMVLGRTGKGKDGEDREEEKEGRGERGKGGEVKGKLPPEMWQP